MNYLMTYALKHISRVLFALGVRLLISNGLNGVNINFLCSKYFGKGAQPFDFIKCNVICKSAYKFRYITEINGGLLLLYGNWRIKFF